MQIAHQLNNIITTPIPIKSMPRYIGLRTISYGPDWTRLLLLLDCSDLNPLALTRIICPINMHIMPIILAAKSAQSLPTGLRKNTEGIAATKTTAQKIITPLIFKRLFIVVYFWHRGQKYVPRPPKLILLIGAEQTVHFLPSRP